MIASVSGRKRRNNSTACGMGLGGRLISRSESSIARIANQPMTHDNAIQRESCLAVFTLAFVKDEPQPALARRVRQQDMAANWNQRVARGVTVTALAPCYAFWRQSEVVWIARCDSVFSGMPVFRHIKYSFSVRAANFPSAGVFATAIRDRVERS
jgi:hypothetical protein